ncbi:TenA family transcriptional regulator [Streptomyces gamaensis]|uniref:TenA family transcriptional regulator n=1 Tax=Streptomyces gamaensis TaxID=1763542 RepID=A0ABW0ZB41_9ACTN
MFSDELRASAAPVLRAVLDHPFWNGLRAGTLPGAALTRFVEQDTGHLLPCYGRAFAHCAATAGDTGTALLLSRCAAETVDSAARLREALAALAPRLGVPPPAADGVAAHPVTRAQCSAVTAAAAASWAAGLGALLPFMVFHLEVCTDLGAHCAPGSRYRPWVEVHRPGEPVRAAVRAVLAAVDAYAAGAGAGAARRAEVGEWYLRGARYEFAFASAVLAAGSDPDRTVRPSVP